MAVDEALLSLASTAGQTVVTVAVTDLWEGVKRELARLLGRGDQARAGLAEGRLDQVRAELASTAAGELEQVQDRLVAVWQMRLLDLLEEHPQIAADLRMFIEQVRAQLPSVAVPGGGQEVAAGRDVRITACGGSIAAGIIRGNVMPANPTGPGLAS
ncbi:MAG TPA: hypothetical protein VFB06_36830 [Streptosporangiaceae bacterium]|nr:hypothetical protein [Streptosporangiaceae bacterium]